MTNYIGFRNCFCGNLEIACTNDGKNISEYLNVESEPFIFMILICK